MTSKFFTLEAGAEIEIEPAGSRHHRLAHVIDRPSIVAINAALATGRPLLVRGEPGVGKSQLARAAAVELGRRFRYHAVDASTEPRDLLYTVDALARLAEAQMIGALGTGSRADVAPEKFTHPGPLWWAFDWRGAARQAGRAGAVLAVDPGDEVDDRGVVLLIDEIDKADSSIPNALLDALGHGGFDVPGFPRVAMRTDPRPLIVVTTNEERSLPDAFLRRCFVLPLGLPDDEGDEAVRAALRVRGKAHFPGCDATLLDHAAELIASRRAAQRRERRLPPGVAEYVDLLDAVLGQPEAGDARTLMAEIARYVLDKNALAGGVSDEREA